MHRFRLYPGLFALLTCLLIIACSPDSAQPPIATNCRTVSHVLGNTEVCGNPEKIVALDAHSLDLLLSLGKQPAGTVSILPLQTERIEQPSVSIPYLGEFITTQPINVGGLRGGASLEVLTQLQPDLIVGESRYIASVADLLPQIAPAIALDVRSQKGKWRDNIQLLAQALGDSTLADAAIERYRQQLSVAQTDLAPVVATHPKVLVMTAASLDKGTFHAITSESFIGELLETLGFELVFPLEDATNAAPLSLEVLPDMDEADSIFILGYNSDLGQSGQDARVTDGDSLVRQQVASIKAEWEDNAIAQSLTASKSDRVYFTTFYQWNLFNGPIGAEMILDELRRFLLDG